MSMTFNVCSLKTASSTFKRVPQLSCDAAACLFPLNCKSLPEIQTLGSSLQRTPMPVFRYNL